MNEKDLKQLNYLGENDRFSFGCTCCGTCCRHRNDIILTAYDLWHIAGYLQKSIEEIIKEYCEIYIGNTSRLPIVRIKPRGTQNICPFLIRNKCVIHTVKPEICAIFPLGRIQMEGSKEIRYFLQNIRCGKKDKTYTLETWLEKSGITKDSQECSRNWKKVLHALFYVAKIIDDFSDTTREACYDSIFASMYLGYDTNEPFLPQIQERQKNMAELSDNLCKMDALRKKS